MWVGLAAPDKFHRGLAQRRDLFLVGLHENRLKPVDEIHIQQVIEQRNLRALDIDLQDRHLAIEARDKRCKIDLIDVYEFTGDVLLAGDGRRAH